MSVFERLAGQQQPGPDFNRLFQEFRRNPAEFLIKSRLNIPANISNPEDMVRHLMNTNQVPPAYRAELNQMLRR